MQVIAAAADTLCIKEINYKVYINRNTFLLCNHNINEIVNSFLIYRR